MAEKNPALDTWFARRNAAECAGRSCEPQSDADRKQETDRLEGLARRGSPRNKASRSHYFTFANFAAHSSVCPSW